MKFLEKVAKVQYRYPIQIIIVTLIITIILGLGIPKISMQSDMSKMNPQGLKIYKLSDRIKDKFGGQDSSFILLRIEDISEKTIYDIRDPKVIKFLLNLNSELKDEELIESVQSIGMIFTENTIPKTLEESKTIFSKIQVTNSLFNKDYSSTMVLISSDLGGGEDKIKEFEKLINDAVKKTAKPEGVKIYITGEPQIRSMILDLLIKDAIYTLILSAVIIFTLLILMQRSLSKATLIFLPLMLGITWTIGSMGWLGIKLSIATVGIGAMILGLGVEYGVFIVSRYKEERKKKPQEQSLSIAVKEVGGSILGSGTTTVTGFLALTLSMMPMLRDLGISLALGITFSLIAAVFINPSFIVMEERVLEKNGGKNG